MRNDVVVTSLSTSGRLNTGYGILIAAQTAHLVTLSGTSPLSEPLQKAVLAGTSATKFGFHAYREAWRASEVERAKR